MTPNRDLSVAGSLLKPRQEMLESPVVHSGFAALVTLPMTNEHRPAAGVDISVRERERLGDSLRGAPQHGDERADTQSMRVATGARTTAMIS